MKDEEIEFTQCSIFFNDDHFKELLSKFKAEILSSNMKNNIIDAKREIEIELSKGTKHERYSDIQKNNKTRNMPQQQNQNKEKEERTDIK